MNRKVPLSCHLQSHSDISFNNIPDDLYWLAQDFNANSLSLSKIREILSEHNVRYRSTALKSELLELFYGHILPRRKLILKLRSDQSPYPGYLDHSPEQTRQQQYTDYALLDLEPKIYYPINISPAAKTNIREYDILDRDPSEFLPESSSCRQTKQEPIEVIDLTTTTVPQFHKAVRSSDQIYDTQNPRGDSHHAANQYLPAEKPPLHQRSSPSTSPPAPSSLSRPSPHQRRYPKYYVHERQEIKSQLPPKNHTAAQFIREQIQSHKTPPPSVTALMEATARTYHKHWRLPDNQCSHHAPSHSSASSKPTSHSQDSTTAQRNISWKPPKQDTSLSNTQSRHHPPPHPGDSIVRASKDQDSGRVQRVLLWKPPGRNQCEKWESRHN